MGSPAHAGIDLYDIEYATAHHEAVTARAKAAITLLIDGPTPRNGQLARAVKTILDDEAGRLEAATDRLEEAVARHYADPTHREVSEANRQRVRELRSSTNGTNGICGPASPSPGNPCTTSRPSQSG